MLMSKIGSTIFGIGYWLIVFSFVFFNPVLAQESTPNLADFSNGTIGIITVVAGTATVFFLIKGGYGYITSTGNPTALEDAKKTIRNALIGLVLIISASTLVSFLQGSLINSSTNNSVAAINMTPIDPRETSGGLVQTMIDTMTGVMRDILESAISPIVDAVFGFLTSTPPLLTNSVVVDFWKVILGIVDTLFVVIVALLGLQFMSASTFGFEEIEFKQLLPRIGLAFLGANISLFLADYIILANNVLVKTVLEATGGLDQAWFANAVNPAVLFTDATRLVTLLFMLIFMIIAIVLLIFYVSRLIILSLGAVLAPFIFLLWAMPKFASFAEIAVKSYLVVVFSVFVHVVTIQLATSYLTLPENTNNSLLSITVAIGLLATLLKTPSVMANFIIVTSGSNMMQKLGSQMMNVISGSKQEKAATPQPETPIPFGKTFTKRRTIKA